MAKSNAARDTLSDEAMREGNSFWQNRQQVSAGSSTSLYLSRIHSMVVLLGLIILILGATLVYLVLTPQTPQVVYQETTKTSSATEPVLVSVVVAKEPIQAGARIRPDQLMIDKVPPSFVPSGALTPQDIPTIGEQFAVLPIRANSPLVQDDLSTNRSKAMAFAIPDGSRAVSITVDSRTGVEGFAKPGTFVDVLWFNNDSRGIQQVTTIVSRAKVLSVAGTTEEAAKDVAVKGVNSGTTATLLVTKKQAQVIELARNLGTLSLSLVGGDEKSEMTSDDSISVSDIYNRKFEAEKPEIGGVLLTYNPLTGVTERHVLKDEDWVSPTDSTELGTLEKTQSKRRAFSRAQNRRPATTRRVLRVVPQPIEQ